MVSNCISSKALMSTHLPIPNSKQFVGAHFVQLNKVELFNFCSPSTCNYCIRAYVSMIRPTQCIVQRVLHHTTVHVHSQVISDPRVQYVVL